MKSRLNLIAAALVVLLGSMVWVVEDRSAVITATALPMAAAPTAVETFVPAAQAAPAFAVAPAPTVVPATAAVAPVPAPSKPAPTVSINASGGATYVARYGDTISQLAIALLGADSKAHRDALVAANGSLQANPDRVLTGQPYSIGSSPAEVAGDVDDQQRDAAPAASATDAVVGQTKGVSTAEPKSVEKPAQDAIPAAAASGPKLRYTAQAGDTVRGLAADLLGGDTKLNRDAIIADNASLQQNPDHMVAGKSYRIDVPNGLSADPTATQPKVPTTQPDADEAVRLSSGRALRYTATSGDTVSKLALKLLGSDTAANRDLIIQSNPSLKADPDQLTAGQTYWIPAPTADSAN